MEGNRRGSLLRWFTVGVRVVGLFHHRLEREGVRIIRVKRQDHPGALIRERPVVGVGSSLRLVEELVDPALHTFAGHGPGRIATPAPGASCLGTWVTKPPQPPSETHEEPASWVLGGGQRS